MYAIAIPAGRLTIRAASDDVGSCELWLNDEWVGNYRSANAAAQSIHRRRSGCASIDAAKIDLPDTIDAWEWISVRPHHLGDQPMFLTPPVLRTV